MAHPEPAALDRLGASCASTLRAWAPTAAAQENLRRDFLRHLDTAVAGWSRGCAAAHITASSLICTSSRRQVLLTHHRLLDRWLQTGGHLETEDVSLEGAALREAREESGLADLELNPVPLRLDRHDVACGPTGFSVHLDVQFLVHSAVGASPVFGPESIEVQWFSVDRLPEIDPSVRELVGAAATRLGW
jgi:8-oxo-dGTP pyrophosphatase MutT (NUDIX family)